MKPSWRPPILFCPCGSDAPVPAVKLSGKVKGAHVWVGRCECGREVEAHVSVYGVRETERRTV